MIEAMPIDDPVQMQGLSICVQRMIDQRKGDYRLRSIAGVEGVVDGAGCDEQGFTAYSVYPFKRRISVFVPFGLY